MSRDTTFVTGGQLTSVRAAVVDVPLAAGSAYSVDSGVFNKALDPDQFNTANWTRNSVTIAAPLFTNTNTGSNLASANSLTMTASHSLEIHAVVERGTTDFFFLALSDQSSNAFGKYFNINTKAVGNSHEAGTGHVDSASIEVLPNGRLYVTVVGHFSADQAMKLDIRFPDAGNATTTTNGKTGYLHSVEWFDLDG